MKKFYFVVLAVFSFIMMFSFTEVYGDIVISATVGPQQGNSVEGISGDVTYTVSITCHDASSGISGVSLYGPILSGVTVSVRGGTLVVAGSIVSLSKKTGTIIINFHSNGTISQGTYGGFYITFSSSPNDITTNMFYYEVAQPVPVELTSFSGSVDDNVVSLKWSTATEISNYGFEIERFTSSSGTNWNKIGFVNGNGNSNSPKEYSYTDNNLKSGSYLYRLKQIDNDGSYDYSNTIEMKVGLPANLELKQNYPNPFNPSTSISFAIPKSGNVSLTIYNSLGKKIATLLNGYTEAGVYNISYQAENLPSGFYVYQLKTGEASLTKKMLFLK